MSWLAIIGICAVVIFIAAVAFGLYIISHMEWP